MCRAKLHLDAGAHASYGLNPPPQSLIVIGIERVGIGMKGEISHPTLYIVVNTNRSETAIAILAYMMYKQDCPKQSP